MAKIDRFYIGQLDGQGLQTDLKPFAIPDNAFSRLLNSYVFRGRVRKRFGARLLRGSVDPLPGFEQIQSRLKINIGTTDGAGNFGPFTVPGNIFIEGQAFSVSDEMFTVYQNGAMLSTGTGTGTYNTATGSVSIAGADAATIVYFFPAQPVTGLISYERFDVNVEDVIAFDNQFSYQFSTNGWEEIDSTTWTGSDSDYFWGASARGTSAAAINLYVTNYSFGNTLLNSDPIRYFDGSGWNDFIPSYNSAAAPGEDVVIGARLIVFFKNRLLFLSVVENTGAAPGTNTLYVNRCRYSWIGDPTAAGAFYDDVPGAGSYIDAPTKEAIVTCQFLKDRLIVYFERSTWELAYTGNQIEPFVWQQINTELGAESTFSQVPFDKIVLGVGNVGIHACNGSNVERIDNKIPDSVFEIHNDNNGIDLVYGIRDYYTEMVYWSFPDSTRTTGNPFNNKVLTYNYKNNCWAFNDDSITVFGYFQTTNNGLLTGLKWGQSNTAWQDANFPWVSAVLQAKFRNVIAGNQQGYVFIVDPTIGENSASLQVTQMTIDSTTPVTDTGVTQYESTVTFVSYDHNVSVGDYVRLSRALVDSPSVDTNLNEVTFKVLSVSDVDTFVAKCLPQPNQPTAGDYVGAGTLQRVTPIDVTTKQYNFYANSDRNCYVSKINFLVDRTEAGEVSIDFYTGTSVEGQLSVQPATGALVGNSILDTSSYVLSQKEAQQTQLWHPVYLWSDGSYCQFRLYLKDDQAQDNDIADSDFQLHAMMINATPTAQRLE